MKDQIFLGFPKPLLGMDSIRLPILFDDGQLLVLLKPTNTLVQAESWYPRLPVLIEAIGYQAASGKPEFSKLNIGEAGLWAITDLDPELSGPVVFARDKDYATALRNEMGSGRMNFTFQFISKQDSSDMEMSCDLPLSRHRHQRRMLVSHTTGKKAVTRFRRIESKNSITHWEAETTFPRRHQLLVHPLEKRIPVLGDTLYAGDQLLFLSKLKRDYQKKYDLDERPLYPGPACFLKQIILPEGPCIEAPPPQKWKGMVKQLEKYRV